jgi:hypothetical protein
MMKKPKDEIHLTNTSLAADLWLPHLNYYREVAAHYEQALRLMIDSEDVTIWSVSDYYLLAQRTLAAVEESK